MYSRAMDMVFGVHDAVCDAVTWILLRLALACDVYRRFNSRMFDSAAALLCESWDSRDKMLTEYFAVENLGRKAK